ncbi:DNA phosphorothioation system sulfurtransferase DndC [Rhodoferax bucti]|uniref:DNA phosphorothioation system sulfurtransferase DndC n=1 Tax=Rhodoferax bucti TaxID=2576305 RepID=UPI0011091175|nr:DNA phosphorothioation system sulfurtransferase DndC [Rhodoferax bucti]
MEHLATSREDVLRIYRHDNRPWVIGYSGGKDSTAVARLVFESLLSLPAEERTKPVFIVSSDTLVETPLVVGIIKDTLEAMGKSALTLGLPIVVGPPVTPQTDETFWVNLIGRGYPAPTRQFRWCTERMKIDPVSDFIKSKVAAYGEVIVVLGSRSQESSSRAQVMRKHRIEGSRLSRHVSLPNAFVFTPIDEWSADDVWEYLFSGPAPWGGDHQALFDLYKGSNAGECPLVIDTSTPSCGNSRFGCWTCTVVTQDRAMDGLIETGHTWMVPLRDFRNELYKSTLPENKAIYRSTKRRDGSVTVLTNKKTGEDKHILGPYKMEYRRKFLEDLLQIQKTIDKTNPGPAYALITKPELEAIRVQWRLDPNEPDWEDSLPQIYRRVMGNAADIAWEVNDDFVFAGGEESLIAELSAKHGVSKELFMKLIELELSFEGYSRRSKLQDKLGELLARDWAVGDKVLTRKMGERVVVRDRDDQEKALLAKYATLQGALGDAA